MYAALQNHVALQLADSVHHDVTAGSSSGAQFLSIRVERLPSQQLLFSVRVNALDYRDVVDRLQSPISNVRGIVVHQVNNMQQVDVIRNAMELTTLFLNLSQDIHERFSRAFVEQVRQNTVYQTVEVSLVRWTMECNSIKSNQIKLVIKGTGALFRMRRQSGQHSSRPPLRSVQWRFRARSGVFGVPVPSDVVCRLSGPVVLVETGRRPAGDVAVVALPLSHLSQPFLPARCQSGRAH